MKHESKIPRFERAVICAPAIHRGELVSVPWMMEKLGISLAQAKRDMVELERVLPVRRERRNGRMALVLT